MSKKRRKPKVVETAIESPPESTVEEASVEVPEEMPSEVEETPEEEEAPSEVVEAPMEEVTVEAEEEVKPLTETEIKRLLFNFINKCERGQVYTTAEVAEELGLTAEQVQEALTSLQPTRHIPR